MDIKNSEIISLENIRLVQNYIPNQDTISLVYLLFNCHEIAICHITNILNRSSVITLEKLAQQLSSFNIDWKEHFKEALAVCQLYGVSNKLGINKNELISKYNPHNSQMSIHVDKYKKLLYLIMEQYSNDSFMEFKEQVSHKSLKFTLNGPGELLILELLSYNIITKDYMEQLMKLSEYNSLEKLSLIFKKDIIKLIQSFSSDSVSYNKQQHTLHIEKEHSVNTFKSNKSNVYDIKNKSRVGLAYIINQEVFTGNNQQRLDDRHGSSRDKIALNKVLTDINFFTVINDNLDSKDLLIKTKKTIETEFLNADSIFILCILSHGIRGHIYGIDSIPVKIDEIQEAIDTAGGGKLNCIPKIIIIQACQVDELQELVLVADSPKLSVLRKSDYLIYWATAPQYEAFRDLRRGSIFIQTLCHIMCKRAKTEHVYDIFTMVTATVAQICSEIKKEQLPLFESTLRKKLFFYKDDKIMS